MGISTTMSDNATESNPYCFTISIRDLVEDRSKEKLDRKADSLCEWLETFWIPGQKRKNPKMIFLIEDGFVKLSCEEAINEEHWKKQVASSLKKIEAEDLGNMDALVLKASIPVEDKESRGLLDLEKMQKQLSVKVIFHSSGHVLLVGQKAKLSKKCFTMRNILSHYHWRLSGKDVALGK